VLRYPAIWLLPAALVVFGSFGVNRDAASSSFLAAVLFAVIAAGAIVLACFRGRISLLLGGAAVFGYFAVGLSNGPIFLVLPAALLAAAQRDRPRTLLPAGIAALVLAVGGLVVRAVVHDVPWPETFWESVGLSALSVGAAVGGWWLVDRSRMRAEQASRAASEEQLRMAQDLHDGVGHGLAVIAMQAGVALHVLERDPAAARKSLEAIRDTSRESLDALRTELARMSGDPAPRRAVAGLADLEPLLERVRAGGLAVDLRGDPGQVPGPVDHTAYVVVQESLTNVLRHARATRATVSLERTDSALALTVSDDGRGPAATPGQDGGMGIAGMRHRVEAIGGALDAAPAEIGFRVHATIPIEAADS
jgi:signal transduction histidine kinase